jgi:hypothetical protein
MKIYKWPFASRVSRFSDMGQLKSKLFTHETSMLRCKARVGDKNFWQHGNWSEAEIRKANRACEIHEVNSIRP